jgi:hypothetical protein
MIFPVVILLCYLSKTQIICTEGIQNSHLPRPPWPAEPYATVVNNILAIIRQFITKSSRPICIKLLYCIHVECLLLLVSVAEKKLWSAI